MQVKELSFIKKKDLYKLGKYADMELPTFMETVKRNKQGGVRVAKFFQNIYDRLLSDGDFGFDENAVSEKNDQLLMDLFSNRLLSDIPIDFLKFYVDPHIFTQHVGELKRKGVKTLDRLIRFQKLKTPQKLKYTQVGRQWQEFVSRHHEQICADWQYFKENKYLPLDYRQDASLMDQTHQAIAELVHYLGERTDNPKYPQVVYIQEKSNPVKTIAFVLRSFYLEGKDEQQIADEMGLSKWRIQDIHAKVIRAFISGAPLNETLYLRPELVSRMTEETKKALFKSGNYCRKVFGSLDTSLFHILGLDFIDVVDGYLFTVPKGTKISNGQVADALVSVLRNKVVPCDEATLITEIKAHKKFQRSKSAEADQVIHHLLLCDDLVGKDSDGRVFLQSKFLNTGEQHIARIIYDAKRPISIKEATQIYEEHLGQEAPSINSSQLGKYGFGVIGTLWHYGDSLPTLQVFINDFAKKKKTFYLHEVEKELQNNGYTLTRSIRTYITNCCRVDKKDNKHFCHIDCTEEFPAFQWREGVRSGISNWILNQMKEILLKKSPQKVKEVINQVEERGKAMGYTTHIRQRAKSALDEFSGRKMPFLQKDKKVKVNKPYIFEFDFTTIAKR